MLFFNKTKTYSLAKFYLALDGDCWADFVQDIDCYIALTSTAVDEYSVNYSINKKFHLKDFKKHLLNLDFGSIESLRLEREDCNFGIFLNTEFKYLELERVYELSFVTPRLGNEFYSEFTALSKKLAEKYHILYGYGRELGSNVDPTTENLIKKSLFGNVSVKIDKAVDIWLENPSGILEGAVKGIYPLNVLSSDKLKAGVLKKLLGSNELKVEPLGDNLDLLSITSDQFHAVKKNSKDSISYVRLD